MAKKIINVGITANDTSGDSLRAAGQLINDNFTELYNALGGETGAPLSIVSKILAGKGIIVSSPDGDVLVTNKTASADEVGGIRIGSGISIDEDGIASVATYELPKASSTILGGIKVGDRLSIDAQGVLSADAGAYTLPKATGSVLGGIKIGSGLEIDPGGIVSVHAFDQTLNTTDVVEFAGVLSKVYTTEGTSAIFHRDNQSITDTGLNIRGSNDKNPIYIYNYGSDGDGTGGSEIDVKELSVDIYTKWGTDEQRKWQFTNLTNNGNALITPTVILGSTGTEDQLISTDSTHSNTFGNTDLKSYIRIIGPDNPNSDNQGLTNAPRANKISIISNDSDDWVDGVGYTSKGRIELIAGGNHSDTHASISMGQLGDMEQAFPPIAEPNVTLTNHIEITGGVAFYGDVIVQANSTLGIRNKIVFQDGSEQTTAYTGSGGGADTGDVVFDGSQLYVGGVGFLNLDFNDQAAIGTNGDYPLKVSLNEGDKEWTFGTDGSITFPDGSVQTTAYTASLTAKLWIAAGDSPGGAASLSSLDGITWTTNDTMLSGTWTKRVAISSTKIVYLISDGPTDGIYYADAPEDVPTLATGTNSVGEGATVSWSEVNYLGGKFVAVGSFETTGTTVITNITSIALADGGRPVPRITLDNIDYNFSGHTITISGATNTELNGTFLLQWNSTDGIRTGVYEMQTEGQTTPTITSTDITGATVATFTANGSSPLFAYSSNGVTWTYGNLDPRYLGNGGDLAFLEMSDVAYDGTGYLIPVIANAFDYNGEQYATGPGAFYITDLTAFVSEGQFISSNGPAALPGNYNNIAAYGDGTFFVSDDNYTVWTGTPTGGWMDHDIRPSLVDAYGWEPGGETTNGDIDSAVAGSVGLNQCFVATTNAGMVISTTDQGSTFQVSIPEPITGTATLHDVGPAMLDFSASTIPFIGEKIILTVANGDDTRWNGTYYIKSGPSSQIFEISLTPNGTSLDGQEPNWTAPSNPFNITFGRGADLDAIAIGDNACVVQSGESGKLYRSTDLVTWTVVASNFSPYNINDIYYAERLSYAMDRMAAGEFEVILNTDGSLTLPTLTTVNWQDGEEVAPTLQLSNDPTNQVIITGPTPNNTNWTAQRLVIQGQQGYGGENNNKGEGGDVYIWAGSGGDAGSQSVRGDGGDVKLRGGIGGNNGGYIRVESGDAQANNGYGGFLELNGGDGNGTGGHGGYVNVTAGYGNFQGGNVNITAGNGGAVNGQVVITAGANAWTFKEDGTLETSNGGHIGAELIGDSSSEGTGFKITVYNDYFNGQGGEADGNGNGDWFYTTDVTGVEVGDTITFRQGEVRTINSVTVNGLYTDIEWSGDAVTGSNTLPRYPVTITSSDYSAPEKKKARIKPDLTAAGDWGQYMDIYAGGGSPVIDSKHIHMSGHTGEIELFLGTDSNYVSAKEAGTAPAGVRLHSENDVAVESSNLRINRKGSTWTAVYGDGNNVSSDGNTSDLTFDCIAVDEHGDYYVGGEHCWRADAIISKYGRDGNLIWSNYSEGSVITGYEPQAIAYHDGEVASIVKTNNGRTTLYLKLMVQDSTTGEVKSTTDIYDPDNTVRANSMIYHSTLGWVVVGKTWGETLVSSTITATGNTGVGIIELPSAQTKLENIFPETNGDWYMTGTSITGDQYLTSGLGMYRDVPITTVTGGGAGAVARVTVSYNGGGTYSDLTVTTQGSGYNSNDELKIPGSLLGGVDGGSSVTATPFSVSPASGRIMVQFSKIDYPSLYDQLNWASYTVSYNAHPPADVISIVDSQDGYWNVVIDNSDINISVATFYTASGNDLTFLAQVSGDALVGPNSVLTGVVSRKTIRLDMGFAMGYGSVDFTGGTFTISRHLSTRPWVWTSGWTRYLDPAINYGSGTAYTVVEVPAGGLLVGGYIDGTPTNHSFIWKLNTNGSTGWLKGILADGQGVRSLAVSTVDGSIYATTTYNQGTLNKLDYTGALQSRIAATGMWGLNPHVKLEIDLDGNEQVYVGGSGGAIWIGPYGAFMLNKFTSNLQPVWGRSMHYNGGESINIEYNGEPYDNFILGKGQATLVGYSNLFSVDYTNAVMFTMDTTDEFTPVNNVWEIKTHADQLWNAETDWATNDLLTLGIEAKTSSAVTELEVTGLALSQWRFQERVVNLNEIPNGIVGVESITFADGNVLDHNPSDIPPSVGFDSQTGWNYTLQLSDRGRFIINQTVPNTSYAQHLYITVPRNDNVPFPVGTVITLINTNSSSANGYKIYVQPESYTDPNAPLIWSTSGNQNPSTWSFQGIQTATLMKISSNGWLLTANDVINED